MTIDLSNVPAEMQDRAQDLDQRLSNLETCYYHRYETVLSLISSGVNALMRGSSLWTPEQIVNAYQRLQRVYEHSKYGEQESLSRVPVTKDTAGYFVCKDLFDILGDYMEEFIKTEPKPKGLLEEMFYIAVAILGVGSRSIRKKVIRYLEEIRKIPGCEERRFKQIELEGIDGYL